MERKVVKVRVFEPLKVEFARDELIGTIEGNKIKYTDQNFKFYKKNGEQYPDDALTLSAWEVGSSRRLDKKPFYYGHDSLLNNYYLRKRAYAKYICPYYQIKKDYKGKVFDSVVKPKYSETKIVPLNLIRTKALFSEEFINSYWHHPNKEITSNNLDEVVEYFRRYLTNTGYRNKEKFINDIINLMPKEDGLIAIYWED